MEAIASVMMLFSVIFPSKMWFAPDQPLNIQIRGAAADVTLVLYDFAGKPVEGNLNVDVRNDQTVDLKQLWPQLKSPGTYVLMATVRDRPGAFIGTPLVIGVREDKRRDAPPGPMVIRVEPLRYAVLSTDKGDMTLAFFYDVAPDTASNFITLAEQGYYDGLTFHRVVQGFVLQGGDPRGDGTGGPGYRIEAEFNSRKHEEGVLSMARQGDPIERQGAMPRAEAANSAGSQFFICLDYQRTMQLDLRYTAFGKVVEGIEAVREIAKVPTDPQTDKPTTPQVIKSVKVLPVTSEKNPYTAIFSITSPTSRPGTPTPTP